MALARPFFLSYSTFAVELLAVKRSLEILWLVWDYTTALLI